MTPEEQKQFEAVQEQWQSAARRASRAEEALYAARETIDGLERRSADLLAVNERLLADLETAEVKLKAAERERDEAQRERDYAEEYIPDLKAAANEAWDRVSLLEKAMYAIQGIAAGRTAAGGSGNERLYAIEEAARVALQIEPSAAPRPSGKMRDETLSHAAQSKEQP